MTASLWPRCSAQAELHTKTARRLPSQLWPRIGMSTSPLSTRATLIATVAALASTQIRPRRGRIHTAGRALKLRSAQESGRPTAALLIRRSLLTLALWCRARGTACNCSAGAEQGLALAFTPQNTLLVSITTCVEHLICEPDEARLANKPAKPGISKVATGADSLSCCRMLEDCQHPGVVAPQSLHLKRASRHLSADSRMTGLRRLRRGLHVQLCDPNLCTR